MTNTEHLPLKELYKKPKFPPGISISARSSLQTGLNERAQFAKTRAESCPEQKRSSLSSACPAQSGLGHRTHSQAFRVMTSRVHFLALYASQHT